MASGQLLALAITLAAEAPVVLLGTMRCALPTRCRLFAALAPSCLTHPLAYRAIGNYGAHDYHTGLWLIESGVVLAEAACLRWILRCSVGTALALSAIANAASAGLGWALW